jgi:hypothetical protein
LKAPKTSESLSCAFVHIQWLPHRFFVFSFPILRSLLPTQSPAAAPLRVAVVSARKYDKKSFEEWKSPDIEFTFIDARFARFPLPFSSSSPYRLHEPTVGVCFGFPVVCAFVNDILDKHVLTSLAENGTKLIALRCAGFNNVDLHAANELGIRVVRVPKYSPAGVAEHAIGMILSLNRRIFKAYNRVREGNFSLEGLLGFELRGENGWHHWNGKYWCDYCEIVGCIWVSGCFVMMFSRIRKLKILAANTSSMFRNCLLKVTLFLCIVLFLIRRIISLMMLPLIR